MQTKFTLILVIIVSISISSILNAQTVDVSLPDTSWWSCETISIPIRVSDVSGLNIFSFLLKLNFDQNVLDATGVNFEGTLAESWGEPTIADQDGQITIAVAGTSPLTGSGDLIYINFNIPGSAGDQTDLSFEDFFFNEGNPGVNTRDGSFTVEGAVQAVNVVIPDTSMNPGSSISVPIRVSDLTDLGISSYYAKINFDQQILDAKSVRIDGTLTESWGLPTVSVSDGEITVANAGVSDLSGSGVLLFINFDVLGMEGERTAISFSDFYFNEGSPSSNTSDGIFDAWGWIDQTSDFTNDLNAVDAVSNRVVWAVGYGNAILRTKDGGDSWDNVAQSLPDTMDHFNVTALSEDTALVVGKIGTSNDQNRVTFIYKTENGGAHWEKKFEQPDGFLNYIKMFNSTEGVATGDPVNGVWTILETSDGGETWSQLLNAPTASEGDWSAPPAVCWDDKMHGCFGTNSSNIFCTTNGGNTWHIKTVPFLTTTYAVAFNNSGHGIASHYNGPLAITHDNGVNWEGKTQPADGRIRHIVAHENLFWLLIDDKIFHSQDNGEHWILKSAAGNTLRYFSFVTQSSSVYGWAVGNNGLILKYAGHITTVDPSNKIQQPDNFTLLQNYPNPFNAHTTIEYILPNPGRVLIIIYDVNGRIVDQIEKIKPAGQHCFNWSALNRKSNPLPSGIYFYQIKTWTQGSAARLLTDIKKMILLK